MEFRLPEPEIQDLLPIERGEKDLRISTLVKLANSFGIPIRDLFKRA